MSALKLFISRTMRRLRGPKRAKNPQKSWLLRAFVVGLLVTCGWIASRQLGSWGQEISAQAIRLQIAMGLKLDQIVLVGRIAVPQEQVLRQLGLAKGTPILAVDLAAVKSRLEAMSWVKEAKVSRQLPGTLVISLSERLPLAIWQMDNKFTVIGQKGVPIPEALPEKFPELPLVVGVGAPKMTSELLMMLETAPELMGRVKASVRVGNRRWDIHFDNGLVVKLPEKDPGVAWQKLASLDASHQILGRAVRIIDMRLGERLVLRLTPDGAIRARDPGVKT